MERSIIFSSEMIKAILCGHKTQTRRITGLGDVMAYPGLLEGESELGALGYRGFITSDYYLKYRCKVDYKRNPGLYHWFLGCQRDKKEINPIPVKCPYGAPGDLLWIRETWRIIGWHDGEPLYLEYKDGTKLEEPGDNSDYDEDKYLQLYLDCSDDCQKAGLKIGENEEYDLQGKDAPTRWRPSIYMPRWASRITLKIINVRVERLQKINKDECLAEGIEGHTENFGPKSNPETIYAAFPEKDGGFLNIRDAFEALWDSINAKRGYSWDSNPWVWVIEFEKIGI